MYDINIVSDKFKGLTTIKQHQMVTEAIEVRQCHGNSFEVCAFERISRSMLGLFPYTLRWVKLVRALLVCTCVLSTSLPLMIYT
jgi:hypothetical protein